MAASDTSTPAPNPGPAIHAHQDRNAVHHAVSSAPLASAPVPDSDSAANRAASDRALESVCAFAFSPAPASASFLLPAPILSHDSDSIDIDIDEPAAEKPSDTLATRRCNIVIRPSHNDSSSKAKKRQKCESRLPFVSKLWTETFEEVFPKLGQKTFEEGIKFRQGSRGYGTATSDCCVFMLEVLKDLYPKEFRGKTLPCFVDIGSGIGNIILQMSALQPDFKCCLGIELETNRAAFAVEACRVFTEKASKNNIQFCQIEAREGNCFDDANCKQALMSASLVWINNEIFQPGDNLKLFKYLHSVVPVNCIIMSFVELLVTKRLSETTPQSDEPTDFLVHPPRQLQNASSWTQPNVFKKVFIIQRQTGKYLSAKNDDGFVSR